MKIITQSSFKSIIIVLVLILNICFAHDENCPNNFICFYIGKNFTGNQWKWSTRMNYRDLPREFHNNVGSFISNNVEACAKNWVPLKTFDIKKGDYSEDFEFGSIIDGISQEC